MVQAQHHSETGTEGAQRGAEQLVRYWSTPVLLLSCSSLSLSRACFTPPARLFGFCSSGINENLGVSPSRTSMLALLLLVVGPSLVSSSAGSAGAAGASVLSDARREAGVSRRDGESKNRGFKPRFALPAIVRENVRLFMYVVAVQHKNRKKRELDVVEVETCRVSEP